MKTPRLALLLTALMLTGCATVQPPALPPEARTVALVAVSSAKVEVRQPLLTTRDDALELVGAVAKVYGADTTARSHLDVAIFDAAGRRLSTTTVQFTPHDLTRGRRAPNRAGYYTVPLQSLPAGTARIEVRADDGEHLPAT